ncbi:ABC transporter permease [Lactobacillus sp. Marseille-P7033]|nr:ABC transporter permease [Lactobacillus sp. Marseille-P7033]NGC78374.1 ABC transporter permease [Limosilactobacillus reuteri]
MAALIYRNLKLYFRNRMGDMMSLLGALIAFFIYIGFLKENLVQEWQRVANANQVLDAWMMGGILTIAGVTTAFGALGQLVSDREDNRYQDFQMTALKQWQLAISYFISAFLISLIMQLVSFVIMAVYFKVTDNLTIKWEDSGKLLLVSLLGTFVVTVFCQIIIEFIHSHVVFNRMLALIGTGIGFAIATYMPVGALSAFGRHLVKVFPSSYIASNFRELLIGNKIPAVVRPELNDYLGIKLTVFKHSLGLSQNLLLVTIVSLLGLGLLIIVNHLKYRQH